MGITFEIPAAPHLDPRICFLEIRTHKLMRTYFGFFETLRLVGVGNIPCGLNFLRIDEIHHTGYIWVPHHTWHHP